MVSNFLSSFYILEISTLSDVGLVKIFSHSVGCLFVLLTMSFAVQKHFSFRKSHLLIVSLYVCASGVILKKWFSVPMCSRLLPTFSSIRFTVAGYMLRFLIPLDLSQYPVISTPFVEDAFFFPSYNFSFFVKNRMFTGT